MFELQALIIVIVVFIKEAVLSSPNVTLISKTDRSSCDPGWSDAYFVGLGCVKFGVDPMTYQEANEFCYNNSAYLVEIHDTDQMDFMMMELKLLETFVGKRNYWGGGTDMNREGQWYWSHSLIPIEEFVWARGQPDGGAMSNYFVFSDEDYMGDDYPSSSFAYALCQKNIIT